MSYESHRAQSTSISANCALITLSDTRTEATDLSGQKARELFAQTAHAIAIYNLIPDEPTRLRALLNDYVNDFAIDAIITNGGTGISARDNTIEVVAQLFDKPLDSFGELFRMLSWQQVGSAAMLSRAIAGIAKGKPIFALPGSTKAVELALTQLILPELGHILHELRK